MSDRDEPRAKGRPRKQAATSKRKLTGKTFACCHKREGFEDEIVLCEGPAHAYPRRFHADCVDDDTFPYLCERCRSDSQSSSQEEKSQAQGTDSQDSTASAKVEWSVAAILASRPDSSGRGEELLLRWALVNGTSYADSWEPASCVESGPLLDAFRASGQPAYDEEFDDVAPGPLTNLQQPNADEAAGNPWLARLRKGFHCVLLPLYDEFEAHPAAAQFPSHDAYYVSGIEILASTNDAALRAVCGAGLQRAKAQDPLLARHLARLRKLSVNRPCIYVVDLCDDDGRSPTVGEMRHLINLVRRYIDEDPSEANKAWAMKVDAVKGDLTAEEKQLVMEGSRRYLTRSNRDKIRVLMDALQRQLLGEDHERVGFVLSDVGYTDNGIARLDKQHAKHFSSNKIMNLIEAVGCADRRLDGVYRMRGDVVFLCFRQAHAPLGEIIFSILAQSYVESGRGLNGVPAGSQQLSLSKYDSMREWSGWLEQVVIESPLSANLQAERGRVAAYERERREALAEIDRLERRVLQIRIDDSTQKVEAYRALSRAASIHDALVLDVGR